MSGASEATPSPIPAPPCARRRPRTHSRLLLEVVLLFGRSGDRPSVLVDHGAGNNARLQRRPVVLVSLGVIQAPGHAGDLRNGAIARLGDRVLALGALGGHRSE